MTERCTWCGADSPLRQAEDLFGTQLLVCDPRCAMTVERALVHINDVAGRVICGYDRAGMAGALMHVLVNAVMAGARFENEADVERWLSEHTGLKALEVASP